MPVDTRSPAQRLKKLLDNLKPNKIITSRKNICFFDNLSVQHGKLIFIEDIKHDMPTISTESMVAECSRITDKVIDTDPCYIMYTSGSTGVPKGVVITHRGVIDYIEWAISALKVNNSDIIGNQAPFFFDNSTLDIYLCWSTGATLHIIPESFFIFPAKLIDYLEQHKITFVFFVPSILVNISQFNVLSPSRLPLLTKIVFAGEVMPTKHLAYWQTMLPEKTYINLYGPTEITVDCTYFIVDRIYQPDEMLPIGYPCLNSGIIILTDDDRAATIGEKGELCVRGSSLALGYWNDEEKTIQVFTRNPLQSNYFERIYRTGDLVFVNEKGQIIFVGRKDSQIKHMGYRIELGEIERAVESLPFITKCCVLYDQDKKEIALFYESRKSISPSILRNDLSALIPNYMLPRRFFHYERLPVNPNGKIDRVSLMNMFESLRARKNN